MCIKQSQSRAQRTHFVLFLTYSIFFFFIFSKHFFCKTYTLTVPKHWLTLNEKKRSAQNHNVSNANVREGSAHMYSINFRNHSWSVQTPTDVIDPSVRVEMKSKIKMVILTSHSLAGFLLLKPKQYFSFPSSMINNNPFLFRNRYDIVFDFLYANLSLKTRIISTPMTNTFMNDNDDRLRTGVLCT